MNAKYAIGRQSVQIRTDSQDLSLLLDSASQVSRNHRSISTTILPKITNEQQQTADRKQSLTSFKSDSDVDDNYFVDLILEKFAISLLQTQNLVDLGYFAAYMDFQLVNFLSRERNRVAKISNFIAAFKKLHDDFSWPYPNRDLNCTVTYRFKDNSSLLTKKIAF